DNTPANHACNRMLLIRRPFCFGRELAISPLGGGPNLHWDRLTNGYGRKLMKSSVFRSIALGLMLMVSLSAFTQISSSKAKEGDDTKGFTEIESFQATVNSDQKLFKLDSTVGWDFNKHFGVFAGVPVYFVEIPSFTTTTGTTTTTSPGSTNNGIGN